MRVRRGRGGLTPRVPDRPRVERSCAWPRTRWSRVTGRCPQGGWAWRSAIQAPHYQTDRDVGAASIGAGLLAAYAVTRRCRATGAPPWPRATSCSASPSRRRRAALARLGRSERASGRRRTSRASTTARPGSATTSGGCSASTREPRFRDGALAGMRWLVAQAEGPSCPADVVLVAVDGRSVLARRATTASAWARRASSSTLDAFADRTGDPTFRAYARAGAARLRQLTARRHAPAAARLRGRDPRDRVPVRLGRRGVHVPRALRARSRPGRSRDRARAAALGERPGGRGPLGRAVLADQSRQRGDAASGFELGAAGIAWVNLRAYERDRRSRVPRSRAPRGRVAAGPWRSADRRGPSCPATPPSRSTSGSTAARPGSAGCWRTSLVRALTRLRTARPPGRRSSGLRAARGPRSPRGVLVRQPDRRPATAARRALMALGLRRDRRASPPGSPDGPAAARAGRVAG